MKLTLTPSIRKLTLTAHVTASVGWLGALAVLLAHALASLMSEDEQMVRAAALAMGLNAWFVIMPLSLASLITGIVQSLGTAWGLVRHYWVLFKLLLTAVATIVLLTKLGPISYLTNIATEATFSSDDLVGLRTSLTIHAAGGLAILLAATVLAIYKPAGMTVYGMRKLRDQGDANPEFGGVLAASTPRWVKVFGIIVIAMIVAVCVMIVIGSHDPSSHAPKVVYNASTGCGRLTGNFDSEHLLVRL